MMSNKMGKPVSQRQLRVGEMIKQSLGMIFLKNEAKVPNFEIFTCSFCIRALDINSNTCSTNFDDSYLDNPISL